MMERQIGFQLRRQANGTVFVAMPDSRGVFHAPTPFNSEARFHAYLARLRAVAQGKD